MTAEDSSVFDSASSADERLESHIEGVSETLTESILEDERLRHLFTPFLPDEETILWILERLQEVLFPGFHGPRDLSIEEVRVHVHSLLMQISIDLQAQVAGALRYADATEHGGSPCDDEGAVAEQATSIVESFTASLPEIRRLLSLDVQAAYDGDPAARHTDETVVCYPGVLAITVHRIAHRLYTLAVPLIPRMMHEHAHANTGIDIHPGASIGESFFVDHGTGVVIGETTHIGNDCKIYQGVTLGAKSFPVDEAGRLRRGVKRHPTLEDNVTVYAGATILGGDTRIGHGTVINGGVFLTESVPPNHVVRAPKAKVRLLDRSHWDT
jgi:serine O-acetyltransferase